MFNAEFKHNVLHLTTHFGEKFEIIPEKEDHQQFRLGGTAMNSVAIYEGVLRGDSCFRAFRLDGYFEATGILSPEDWSQSSRHCYVHEYYPLDMEGKPHSWLISRKILTNINQIFINIDVMESGQVVKRYRVSPFFGDYKIIQW